LPGDGHKEYIQFMTLLRVLFLVLVAGISQAADSTAVPQDSLSGRELGAELRMMALCTPYEDLELEPSEEYPKVYGVVMDWPIKNEVVSLFSLSDGSASIYSTTGFGVIGGYYHTFVRRAAEGFVKNAGQFYDDAQGVKEYPLPDAEHVRFYLLCYDGVRMIEADSDSLENEEYEYSPFWNDAQKVMTELRLIVDQVETGH
jgi:hypothetical protein